VNARGFTLLEVLVALSILGVAVVASIQGFAGGLRLLKLSGDHQEAMLFADQKMREVVTPAEGREDGTEDRFHWTRTISKVPTPELVAAARPINWSVYEVDVRVRWDERREVQLTTLRTVSDTPPPATAGTPTTPRLRRTP
jgi:type II secretion system protein I